MSRELNELKSSLRVAAASVSNDEIAARESSCSEPTFSSSEAAVQAILECLKNNEFLTAIRYIRECRWDLKGLFFCTWGVYAVKKIPTVRQITLSFFTAEQCGLTTSLAATLRMRSRPCSTSTSDIRPWVRQELLLWWAQNRTWQKSLSSWWNLTERFGTWSDEPKATEPLQPSSQTLGFQAQLFDGGLAACDTRSCTAACPMPSLWSCLGLLLSSQWLTSTLLSPGNNQTPFPLLAQSTSQCHKVRSSDVQQYCFLERWETLLLQREFCKAFIALIIEIVTKRPLATEVNNFTFNKWHTKAKWFSFSYVVLNVKGKRAILHRSGRLLLYPERMYLNIIAFENMNIVGTEKGRLHYLVKVVCLFVCLCVGVLCVGARVCDINLTTITDGIMDSDLYKLFTFNYFDMLQNYCNVS